MKENLLLKKLLTNRNGESSILILLMCTGMIIFIVMPLFAFSFDRALITIVSQDAVDEIEIVTLKVYPSISQSDLSLQDLKLSKLLKSKINDEISNLEIHSMIESIEIIDVVLNRGVYYSLDMHIEISLKSSLYRDTIGISPKYNFNYTVMLPINN